MNLYNNTGSSIDITLASQDIVTFSSWQIIDDNIGSDHKPILIKIQNISPKTKQKIVANQEKISLIWSNGQVK